MLVGEAEVLAGEVRVQVVLEVVVVALLVQMQAVRLVQQTPEVAAAALLKHQAQVVLVAQA
jgi:hypothetical protein